MKTQDNQYSVREVSRIFGLNESRIRYWAQTGFVNPSGARAGKRVYTFHDLVSIKAAKELLDQGIPLQRVRRNIQALRDGLPQLEQPLTKLRVYSDGERLVVNGGPATFEPLSGQQVLDFGIDELRSAVAEVLELHPGTEAVSAEPTSLVETRPPADTPATDGSVDEHPTTAYGWFLHGCAHDQQGEAVEQIAEAITAYQRALDLDPSLAAAHTNLGNLFYGQGRQQEARRAYEMACALEPEQPQARYNLANLYEEEGDLEMAIAEYRRALASDPDFADAHFNLALALEAVGSRVQAVRHWKTFLQRSDVDPPSATFARARLAELSEAQ
jgi:tetratricopeptide (TPR) repeat protein